MSINAIDCSAMNFLREHEGEHLSHDLPRLVDRCIVHLVENCAVSRTTAHTAAMQALGELESRRSKTHIDCSRTTSFVLFLTGEDGQQMAVTAVELARLFKEAQPRMQLFPG